MKFVKTELTVIDAADFASIADHIKSMASLGDNSKQAVANHTRAAYAEMIAQAIKLPNLAKRSSDRIAMRKAIETHFDKADRSKSKAKRLVENAVNFVLKASADTALEPFLNDAREGNIPGMVGYMEQAELTESKIVKYVKGDNSETQAEKIIKRWAKYIRDDGADGRDKVEQQAEELVAPLVEWLTIEGFIDADD